MDATSRVSATCSALSLAHATDRLDPARLLLLATSQARRSVAHAGRAEEVAESAFHCLALALCRNDTVSHPGAWIRRVTVNLAAKWRRSRRASEESFDALGEGLASGAHYAAARTGAESETVAQWRERFERILPALDCVLTARQRRVLHLILSNCSMRAIARAAAITPSDVRRVMRAICAKARSVLARACVEPARAEPHSVPSEPRGATPAHRVPSVASDTRPVVLSLGASEAL
jgi:DNA-directed RNA polymerase specialized sigma24 family protein